MAKFDNIAVGAQVIVRSGSYDKRRTDIHTVEYVTKGKTQFTAGGIRFTKQGHEIGGSDHWSALAELATPERIAEVTVQAKMRQPVAAANRQLQALRARVDEIARCGGVTVDDVASAAGYLQAAMEQLTPPDAAAAPAAAQAPDSTARCYAITRGEYSEYTVLAVFSTRKEAEQQLPLWEGVEVEEFPYNATVPQPPAGMRAYRMARFEMDGCPPEPIAVYDYPSARSVSTHGDEVFADRLEGSSGFLHTYMFARDKEHAIKIASERFAKYDAIKASIAPAPESDVPDAAATQGEEAEG